MLALQLVGINLAGAGVFRVYGVAPDLDRRRQGKKRRFHLSLRVSVIALISLLLWQFSGPIRLQRSSQETRMAQVVAELMLFLASDAASNISGTAVWIDGAQSLQIG